MSDEAVRILAPKPRPGMSDALALRMTLEMCEEVERARSAIDRTRPVWARITIRRAPDMTLHTLGDYGCPVLIEDFHGPKRWEIEIIPVNGPVLIVEADS